MTGCTRTVAGNLRVKLLDLVMAEQATRKNYWVFWLVPDYLTRPIPANADPSRLARVGPCCQSRGQFTRMGTRWVEVRPGSADGEV